MRTLALLLLVAACHGASLPPYDDKLLAPEVKGLRLGASTLADVTRAFPDVQTSQLSAVDDRGNLVKDRPGPTAARGKGIEAQLVDGKLDRVTVTGRGLLAWLVKTMHGLDGATACPGNRKVGKLGDVEAVYCADAAGRAVFIEATRGSESDSLTYYFSR